MIRYDLFILIISLLLGVTSCRVKNSESDASMQIAFMADVHLHDIYGNLSDTDYKGVQIPGTDQHVIARSMKAQLNSTRLFNENYFAFKAALDDAAQRGIKFIVMPGDFSDDGQPMNIRGLKRILEAYSNEYDMRFILTTGNHDPVRPYTIPAGKNDFIGKGGKHQTIMSSEGVIKKHDSDLPAIITNDICKLGYKEIIRELSEFGFTPQPRDLYWETPFSSYDYNSYSYQIAAAESKLEKRIYQITKQNITVPDVSYLIEPKKGLWFLAIDANVYIPKETAIENDTDGSHFGSASIGYNNVLTHKQHLLGWVEKVCAEAKKYDKQLIIFSHYPMVDFNDDASDHIRELMGNGKMQLHRVPQESVAKLFAEAGVRVHFGGHMHINDTGFRDFGSERLINIQIPSLAAYMPAYKLATIEDGQMYIETIVLDKVNGFRSLFPLYQMEFDYLKKSGQKSWNSDLLKSNTYLEFTNWHLKEMVKTRFLKKIGLLN